MKSKVTLVPHPETGALFTPSKDATKAANGWGTVRVDAKQAVLQGNLIVVKNRTAFLNIQKEALDFLGYKSGQVMPGTVVREMQYTPFYEGQEPVKNPETGATMLHDGSEFYQNFRYTEEANAESDTWIVATEAAEPVVATAGESVA